MGKQHLSPEAAKKKAARDLAFANSPERKAKRAEDQRLRRKAKKNGANLDGKDYDHNTKRFISAHINRGGTQNGGTDGTVAEYKKRNKKK